MSRFRHTLFSGPSKGPLNRQVISRPIVCLLLVLTLIGTMGLTVVDHYGISWDEEATAGVVDVNYQIITQGGENDHRQYHRQYYGTWYNIAAEAWFKAQLKGQQILGQPTAQQIDPNDAEAVMRSRLASKHGFTFVLSLVTYIAVAGLVAILAGPSYAWLGPLALLLIPRFWGNSFFNPKDIPLAAMFTLGTLLGTCLIRHYSSRAQAGTLHRLLPVGLNATTGYTLLYGILVGFVAGTRIDSSVLALYVILIDAGLQLGQRQAASSILRSCRFYALLVATTALTTVALYPAAWINPLQWYLAAFNFYYKEDWPHTVLFKGVNIFADSLPWDYLPTWIIITTPSLLLSLFVLGVILIVCQFKQLSVSQRACALLIGLQIFGLPGFAILYQATLFDSLRQVLYVLPGIAAIAAVAVAWLFQHLRQKQIKLAIAATLVALALPIGLDMAALHPYEYLYFNRAFGGLPAAAGQFETDYWGLSMADAVSWLNQAGDRQVTLVSTEPISAANLLADEDFTVVTYSDFESDLERDFEEDLDNSLQNESEQNVETTTAVDLLPFYYLSPPRWRWSQRFEQCPIVYTAIRQQVPLAQIKRCGPQTTTTKNFSQPPGGIK